MPSALKRILVGKPIPSSAEMTQRLTKLLALAVFSSDAVSSTAYATEEILDVLVPEAGLERAIDTLVPISHVVVVEHVWQEGLRNQSLLTLANGLRGRERTVVATYSYRVDA